MRTADLPGRWSAMLAIMVTLVSCTAFISRAHFTNQSSPSGPPSEPVIVDAGPVGGPPSDAIVLFDGKDLSHWNNVKGGEAKWQVKDGVMIIVPHSGNIATKQEFGDVQLHLEWATPAEVIGAGQGRGNSGVFLMGQYEVQILDSFENKTYFDGQAAAIYKQYQPLVNASRAPGQWQAYDIIFHAPSFDDQGKVTKRGRVTVLHNGVLVQDNVEIMGSTSLKGGAQHDNPEYKQHPPKAPLVLQDHNNPVRFRNIWVRPL
jgi:Domain of Unknown Function (DUF1080)